MIPNKQIWPCIHISSRMTDDEKAPTYWFYNSQSVPKDWIFCPECGMSRPRTEIEFKLDEAMEHNFVDYTKEGFQIFGPGLRRDVLKIMRGDGKL